MVGGDGEREARERTGGGAEGRGQEDEEEEAVIQVVRTDGQEKGLTEIPPIAQEKVLTFLHALTIFFKSYSEESPCTVVKVLRPFRCWILICTRPSWTSSSEPLIASAKGSARKRNKMPSS